MKDQNFLGTVVLPDRVIENGFVHVADGVVRMVGEGTPPSGERHGGPGMLVLPGAIDAQVHSRSQAGQEDFVWSTRSAAAGGVTTANVSFPLWYKEIYYFLIFTFCDLQNIL